MLSLIKNIIDIPSIHTQCISIRSVWTLRLGLHHWKGCTCACLSSSNRICEQTAVFSAVLVECRKRVSVRTCNNRKLSELLRSKALMRCSEISFSILQLHGDFPIRKHRHTWKEKFVTMISKVDYKAKATSPLNWYLFSLPGTWNPIKYMEALFLWG